MKSLRIFIGICGVCFLVAAIGVAIARLSGVDAPVLQPKGFIAREQFNILIFSTLIMLIVVVPVFVMLFLFAWKFRASNTKAAYRPNWDHNRTLELLWWGIPCAIIAVLAVVTWVTSHTLDPFKPIESDKKPITVQVVALQWKWLFIYPDDQVASVNYLRIPVDTPVNFHITSDAPMNSFWIPSLAGQVYAMSGMTTKLHVIADTPGTYRGSSANISGEGFADMNFSVEASSRSDYDKWIQEAQGSASTLDPETYAALAKPTKDVEPRSYVMSNTGLYDTIVMKYMMPAGTTAAPRAEEHDGGH